MSRPATYEKWPEGMSKIEKDRMRRARRLAQELCIYCGKDPRRPGLASCEPCGTRNLVKMRSLYRARREAAQERRAVDVAIARRNGCRDKPGECVRCTEPRAPESELCAMHVDLMAELAAAGELAIEEDD